MYNCRPQLLLLHGSGPGYRIQYFRFAPDVDCQGDGCDGCENNKLRISDDGRISDIAGALSHFVSLGKLSTL